MKYQIIFLLGLLLFYQCGGGTSDETDPTRLNYKAQEDLRTTAEAPLKIKDGYNFSILAPKAKNVTLVGDFNNWIDNRNPMEKNKYGVWSVTIPLKKGVYSYKFNIDGNWIIDKNNPEVVKDTLGDRRSLIEIKDEPEFYHEPIYFGYTNAFPPVITMSGVLFTYNDKFAQQVTVAGTFNNWEKNDFPLQKNKNGIWSGYVQIPKGEYYYKFVVDGLWKYDVQNPDSIDDGSGDYKSHLVIERDIEDRADKPFRIDYEIVRFHFYNKNLPSAYRISVIGDFNDWRSNVNIMLDDDYDKEWFTTVRLKEGEYYYKFLLTGKEFFDPENDLRKETPEGKEANYLKISIPNKMMNIKFTYYNNKAKKVSLVGDFNHWDVEVDVMEKDQYGLWYIVKKLTTGKYAYQYIVDNQWLLDLSNPYTVVDQNGDMNSFLEVK